MRAHASTINSNAVTNAEEMSMSSKAKRTESAEPQTARAQLDTRETSVGKLASDEDIRRRAYEIYLGRGEQPGHDLDDWLKAERELETKPLSRAQVA
jgi:hypothetical protein